MGGVIPTAQENTVRVGIRIPPTGPLTQPGTVRALARGAEGAGLDSVWVGDRVVGEAAVDPIGTLQLAAAATSRIRLGTAVLAGSWYPPLLLARALATLDQASGGRVTVGLGIGRSAADSAAVGVARRYLGDRFEELLDVLDAAWGDDPAAHTGARVRFGPTAIAPKPWQRPRPPLVLAASTPNGLDRIARRADGWIVAGLGAESIAPMWRAVRELATGYRRDPAALRLVVCTPLDEISSAVAVGPDEIVVEPAPGCDSVDALLQVGTEARRRALDAPGEVP